MTTFSIEVPFFDGFYNTIFDNSEAEYYLLNDHFEWEYLKETYGDGIKADDFTFDWNERETDIAKRFTKVLHDEYLSNIPFIENVRFDEIDSPRFYNYRNDNLYIYVDFADDWKDQVRHFIATNYNWLQEKIHEDWTSRSGFRSFLSNDIDDWGSYLFDEEDPNYISEIIKYMLIINKDFDEIRDDLNYSVLEDIYDSKYLYYTPKEDDNENVAEVNA